MDNDRDVYPIRLEGKRKAFLILPADFTHADAAQIKKWLDVIPLGEDEPPQRIRRLDNSGPV